MTAHGSRKNRLALTGINIIKVKFFLPIIIFSFLLALSSCHDDAKLGYVGCCETEIKADSFGHFVFYLPNVFTPNEDGINDRFNILGDSIRRILNFEIRDKFEKVIYQAKNYDYPGYEYGWDGKVDGKVGKGIYDVFITIETNTGVIGNIESKVCNYPCGVDGYKDDFDRSNCLYASQWNCYEGCGGECD